MERRYFLGVLASSLIVPQSGRASSSPKSSGKDYLAFCNDVRQEALSQGISSITIDSALSCTHAPNQGVLERVRHQPEFTLSWSQYRDRVVRPKRVQKGKEQYQRVRHDMDTICQRFGCDSSAVMGIWGIESGFGVTQGSFNVIDALATLAFEGRRTSYFRRELMQALAILEQGNISAPQMFGSYAGAMGQVQFMPSAYMRFAADGNNDGKKDIWNTEADIFASASNYLAQNNWEYGEAWGEEVTVPLGEGGHFDTMSATTLRSAPKRVVAQWRALGVKGLNGHIAAKDTTLAQLLQPDGAGGQAFLVYNNFRVFRSYNPSDYYALAVGLLGDGSVAV